MIARVLVFCTGAEDARVRRGRGRGGLVVAHGSSSGWSRHAPSAHTRASTDAQGTISGSGPDRPAGSSRRRIRPRSARHPASTSRAPSPAIIAPLSVQRSSGGIRSCTPAAAARDGGHLAQPPVGDDAPAEQQARHARPLARVERLGEQHVDDRLAEGGRDVVDRERRRRPRPARSTCRATAVFSPEKREVEAVPLAVLRRGQAAREADAAGSPPARRAVDRRTAGVGQAEQPGGLVERLPRRVVERLAEQLHVVDQVADEQQGGVAAGDEQRDRRQLDRPRRPPPTACSWSAVTWPTRWFTP